ncbi:hypothetical protein BLNAU_19504 [Blattamonas nauphoetae]|uniref:Right handed beta helix domain-containing protein n=1 Tax=Blattamonas nauphoetae TaxID=2049346 RepID=A0ABQ9X1H8_9EUKA|nr:hypothetical protein BLNAU_19504 [Blattamonas nauphoetae]
MSHLSQTMLGCVVSLSSSHLSGSTIRDVNNGGSVLCSNSSFSSLLSSPNTDSDPEQPSMTLPNGTYPFDDDGTAYNFTSSSGNEHTFATFSHCHFTGDKYLTNARPLTFKAYPGTITITSCSFTNIKVVPVDQYDRLGGATIIDQRSAPDCQPVTVEKTNFTNIKASMSGSGMYIIALQSTSIEECRFEECGPGSEGTTDTGGLYVFGFNTAAVSTIKNLVFVSCSSNYKTGGMYLNVYGPSLLSDCLFDGCSSSGSSSPTAGAQVNFNDVAPTTFTRINFTDCESKDFVAGMYLGMGVVCLVKCSVSGGGLLYLAVV